MRTVSPEHLVLRASETPLAALGPQFGRCPSHAPLVPLPDCILDPRGPADGRDLSASMDRAWQASSSSLITSRGPAGGMPGTDLVRPRPHPRRVARTC